jgi:hypothetical protein
MAAKIFKDELDQVSFMLRKIKQFAFLSNEQEKLLYDAYVNENSLNRFEMLKTIYDASRSQDLEYSQLLKRKLENK